MNIDRSSFKSRNNKSYQKFPENSFSSMFAYKTHCFVKAYLLLFREKHRLVLKHIFLSLFKASFLYETYLLCFFKSIVAILFSKCYFVLARSISSIFRIDCFTGLSELRLSFKLEIDDRWF